MTNTKTIRHRAASLLLFCAAAASLLLLLSTSVAALGVPRRPITTRRLCLLPFTTGAAAPHRSIGSTTRTFAALIDDPSSQSQPPNSSSSTSSNIRSRVQSFLRSKKSKHSKRPRFVQEVTDIDTIGLLLNDSERTARYTAVIFHAPYCKACKAAMPLFENLAKKYTYKYTQHNTQTQNTKPQYTQNTKPQQQQQQTTTQQSSAPWRASSPALPRDESLSSSHPTVAATTTTETSTETITIPSDHAQPPQQQPSVRFLSVPVTQENAEQLSDRFGVTRFPLAHIYDPTEGLVDERPVLRKRFAGFEERLASVVTAATKTGSGTATKTATPAAL